MQNKKIIISSVSIITLFLILSTFLISKGGPSGLFLSQNNSTNCKDVQEAYYELQPYNDQQCVSIPYTENQCENKTLVYSKDQKCYWSGSPLDTLNSECTINNLDNAGGNFVVNIGVATRDNTTGENLSAFIYPQSSFTFKYSSQADIGSCFCNEITIPSKEMCNEVLKSQQECYNITRFRNVTNYKTVQKCG